MPWMGKFLPIKTSKNKLMTLIIGKTDKPYIENAKNFIRTTSLIEEIDKILDEKTIRLFGGI